MSDLIAELKFAGCACPVLGRAADRIAALEAENERLRARALELDQRLAMEPSDYADELEARISRLHDDNERLRQMMEYIHDKAEPGSWVHVSSGAALQENSDG